MGEMRQRPCLPQSETVNPSHHRFSHCDGCYACDGKADLVSIHDIPLGSTPGANTFPTKPDEICERTIKTTIGTEMKSKRGKHESSAFTHEPLLP